jgi:hypothetical protein
MFPGSARLKISPTETNFSYYHSATEMNCIPGLRAKDPVGMGIDNSLHRIIRIHIPGD